MRGCGTTASAGIPSPSARRDAGSGGGASASPWWALSGRRGAAGGCEDAVDVMVVYGEGLFELGDPESGRKVGAACVSA